MQGKERKPKGKRYQKNIATREEQYARRERLKADIVRDVRKGRSNTEAARRHGVTEPTFWRWESADPEFRQSLSSARAEADDRIKENTLARLRAGKTLMETSKTVGRTPGTLRAWRSKDAAFDARVKALLREQRKRRAQKKGQAKERKNRP
jgi:Homeodomain-like domain-containing protein